MCFFKPKDSSKYKNSLLVEIDEERPDPDTKLATPNPEQDNRIYKIAGIFNETKKLISDSFTVRGDLSTVQDLQLAAKEKYKHFEL